MPVNYQIPPWLTPQAAGIWGQLYARGVQAGQQRAHLALQAQAQQQHAAQTQAEFAAKQEALHQQQIRKDQELAMDSAYKEALIGIKERELEQKAQHEQDLIQAQQAKINAALQHTAAQMRIGQRVRAGEDPMQVLMEEGPNLGMTPDAFARMVIPKPEQAPVNLGEQIPLPAAAGARIGVRTGPRSMTTVKTGADDTWLRNQKLNELRIKRRALQKQLESISGLGPAVANLPENKNLAKQISALDDEIETMLKPSSPAEPTGKPSRTLKIGQDISDEEVMRQLEAFRPEERGGAADESQTVEGEGDVGEGEEQPVESEPDTELLSDEDIDKLLAGDVGD